MTLQDKLIGEGYRLVEDAWDAEGRLTYIHDDQADRDQLASLIRVLGGVGWEKHNGKLRSFINRQTNEEIEVEPGGSDVSGHFLHHMKLTSVT
jgi:hypothetical protein